MLAADDRDTDVTELPRDPKPPTEGPHVFEMNLAQRMADQQREQNRVIGLLVEVLRDLRDELEMSRRQHQRFEDLLERHMQKGNET